MKGSKNLRNCLRKLSTICEIKNPKLRQKVLQNLYDDCLYNALYEITANVTSKNIPLSKRTKENLYKRKKDLNIIRELSHYTRNKRRRKRLVTQSGGFLPLLLPTVASILTSLIAK